MRIHGLASEHSNFCEGTMNISSLRFFGLALCVTLLAGCEEQQAAGPNGDAKAEEQAASNATIDKHGDEALAGQNKGEAREWLKDASHIFFKGDRKQIAQFIEDFYSAGATQVYIVDTEKHNGSTYGGAILVVLPQDSGARAKIFAKDKNVARVFDEDSVTDQGQKYLYHAFD
jgi:hypothetical protein